MTLPATPAKSSIRIATSADAPQITAVINAAFRVAEEFFIDGNRITQAEIEESLTKGAFLLAEVNGKAAVIVTKLPGAPRVHPAASDCHDAGRLLAEIHLAGIEYDAGLENWRGRAWRERFAEALRPLVSRAEADLIDAENKYQAIHDNTVLPQGVIHGDYFHDNVLWDDDGSAGVIDFYFACDDALAYDAAIGINDWCVTPEARVDDERARAFIAGYESQRPFTDFERELWPAMLRRAALRTWLGRLGYNHFPRASEMTIPKDHAFSRRLLESHIANTQALAGLVA